MTGPLLAAAVIVAQLAAEPPSIGHVSLSAGVGAHSARLDEAVISTSIKGVTPTQLRLSSEWFFWRQLGLTLSGMGEWYSVTGKDFQNLDYRKPVAAYRIEAAVAGRLTPLGWLMLEAQLGWQYQTSPTMEVASGAVFAKSVSAHGPYAALLVTAGRPSISGTLSLRAAPLAAGAQGPVTTGWKEQSYGFGAQVAIALVDASSLRGAVIVDYTLTSTQGSGGALSFSELSHQIGAGFRVDFGIVRSEPVRPVEVLPGLVRGHVVVADSKAPVAGAAVTVGAAHATSDAKGEFELSLDPGEAVMSVEAPGFLAARATADVSAGRIVEVTVALERPAGPGSITGLVMVPDGSPVANLEVEVEGHPSVSTGTDGRFTLTGVGPGPVDVLVRGDGYQPLKEPVRVTPGGSVEVKLTVHTLGSLKPGTLRGLIRSVGGKTVAATVRVVEAKLTTQVGKDGRFEVTVPAGKYTVIIEARGFESQTISVELAGGDHAIFHCDLHPSSR